MPSTHTTRTCTAPWNAWPPAARRLAADATRVGVKDLFEDLRRDGVVGLNNNYTALYARRLVDDHPRWAGAFELRRRAA